MSAITGTRNASLKHMVDMLKEQQARKIDVVASATALRARNGRIELRGIEPFMSENGVTIVDGNYLPTAGADADIAGRLDMPVRYIRKLRSERPDLYDLNVNGLLHGRSKRTATGVETIYEADTRNFLLRLFAGEQGGEGVLRAVLSDQYGMIDHLDVVTAVLQGIRDADAEVEVRSCDLTDSYMSMKVFSPSVAALAPTFLGGYRNPFAANPELEDARRRVSPEIEQWRAVAHREGMGYQPGQEPVVFAGFRVGNSETGDSKVSLKPELYVKICRNGLTLPAFEISKVHIGAKMDAGVQWSLETQNKNLQLIASQARDAVRSWLSAEWVAERVQEIEEAAGAPVKEPEKTLKVVSKRLGFSDIERDGILSHFIAGGQLTAAGVANAITSYSQTVSNADRADALDDLALQAMQLVA